MVKIKWRNHELALAGILALLYIASDWWKIYGLSRQQTDVRYGGEFLPHMAFSYYRNVLFPHALRLLFPLVFLAVVNLRVIPRWLFPKKRIAGTVKAGLSSGGLTSAGSGSLPWRGLSLNGVARSVGWPALLAGLGIVFFSLFIGVGWTVSFYFEEEYLFNYPGFSFFPHPGYFPQPQIGLNSVIGVAFKAILAYTVYLCLREVAIWFIGRPGERRTYRVLIANQCSGFLAGLMVIYVMWNAFDLFSQGEINGLFFSCIPAAFFVFMSNVYWIFPLKGERPFYNPLVLVRLSLSCLLYTVLFFAALAPYEGPAAVFFIWLGLLLVVTPVSWLVYRRRKDRIIQLRGLEKALGKSKADLQFLRSQINPHFLFNTLNTLYGTALQENAVRTADGVQKLGDMMRFMLHDNNRDLILMSSEIEYLHNYIYLQKLRIRSSDGILIEDNIRREHRDHMIAPMLLIPFVENAFKHGISLRERSWIMIDLHCDEKNIRFRIRNSVHARLDQDPERDHSGIGMKNVVGRLKLLYPGKFELEVREEAGEYTVELNIQP